MTNVDQNLPSPITATSVPNDRRLDFLPRFFGNKMLRGESLVYFWLRAFCSEYTGGYWDFYELSNGAFYMAPKMDSSQQRLRLCNPDNFFEGETSPDAAGIIASLMAVNGLACETRQDRYIDLFYLLRDYALAHPEATAILRAID